MGVAEEELFFNVWPYLKDLLKGRFKHFVLCLWGFLSSSYSKQIQVVFVMYFDM